MSESLENGYQWLEAYENGFIIVNGGDVIILDGGHTVAIVDDVDLYLKSVTLIVLFSEEFKAGRYICITMKGLHKRGVVLIDTKSPVARHVLNDFINIGSLVGDDYEGIHPLWKQ